MSSTSDYTPPKVWTWNKANGGRFANINRPIAGPTHDKEPISTAPSPARRMTRNCLWAATRCSFIRSARPMARR